MELNIETPFDTLNDVVVEALGSKGIDIINCLVLKELGFWYHKFVLSQADQFHLIVPYYQKEFNKPLLEYLFNLDLLLKLIVPRNGQRLEEYALFDIMSYRLADKYNKRNKEFKLRFLNATKTSLSFEKDVNVASDRFLPMFPIDQIDSYKDEIFDAFFLFSTMAKRNLISHKVSIDFSKNLTLLITESSNLETPKLLFKHLQTSEFRGDDNKRDEILDSFESLDIKNNINYKYPYHVNIGSTVIKEFNNRAKQFNIELQHRLCYSEILDNELVLTPNELNLKPKTDLCDFLAQFVTIKTSVTNDFNLVFKEFKNNWKQGNFNAFISPFPIRWFMMIHSGEPVLFWKTLFINDYPNLSGNLLREALSLIEIIYEINWLDNYLPTDSSVFLLIPRLNISMEIITSFKNHLAGRYEKIGFIDDDLTRIPDQSNIWIIDPFNILFFSNSLSKLSTFKVKVLIPDFINFGHNPYIRYHIAKYQYAALIEGARKWADPNYSKNLEAWNVLKNKLLDQIKIDIQEYYSRFVVNDEPFKLDTNGEEISVDKLELSDSELIQYASKKEERFVKKALVKELLITKDDGSEIALNHTEPILLDENGCIIRTVAAMLYVNSRFIPVKEIVKNINVGLIADRMTSISPKAKSWRNEMFLIKEREPNLFSTLSTQGLSVTAGTFNNDYISQNIEQDGFQLPRSKMDWKIVCEKIGISDMLPTWMAHKSRSDINALKKAYSDIINFLILKDSFGMNVTDSILKHVSNILSTLPDAELDEQEIEINTRLVIAEISRRIKLSQVKNIKDQI